MITFRCFLWDKGTAAIENSFVCPMTKGHSRLWANWWLLYFPKFAMT
jgi:hypothetical protein